MDFKTFETHFLMQLKLNNKNCLNTIENNKILIEENLGNSADPEILDNFVNEIINIVININKESNLILFNNSSNFKLIENALSHPNFNKILEKFNNSNVLIRACQVGNKKAAKWLMTMNINPYLQDDDGMSAPMYAAQQGFDFVIKPFLYDSRCMNLEDKNSENVLFHALRNPNFITQEANESNFNRFPTDLINSSVHINHTNKKGETVLTHCIKNDIFKPINQYLLRNPNMDVNIADNDGITAVMYLTEKGRYSEFVNLHKRNCNYDYIDMNGHSALSILMKNIYSTTKESDAETFGYYIRILSAMVSYQCDCNIPIDSDENTAFMVCLIMNDTSLATFFANHLKKLDLSVRNKYGENGTSLCFKFCLYNDLYPIIKNNVTFDYHYRDPINQNTLLMLSAINSPSVMKELLENDPSIINEVNCKNENALIISTKINHVEVVKILLEQGINVNQQDCLGNTALHYAVSIQKPNLIQLLLTKKINIHLKNHEGKTALDMAYELKDHDDIIQALKSTIHSDTISILVNNNESTVDVDNPYYEEVHNYLIPYANNDYPDYEVTEVMRNIRDEVLSRYGKPENDSDFGDILLMMFPITGISVITMNKIRKSILNHRRNKK